MTRTSPGVARVAGSLVLVLLLIVCGSLTGSTGMAAPANVTNCTVSASQLALDAEEARLLFELNLYRASKGQATLVQSETLRRVATWMSVDSAKRKRAPGNLVDSLGRYGPQLFGDCGYPNLNVPGVAVYENVCCDNFYKDPGGDAARSKLRLQEIGCAGGDDTARTALCFWGKLPGVSDNLLVPEVRYVGVSRECGGGECYWTLTLGTVESGLTELVPQLPPWTMTVPGAPPIVYPPPPVAVPPVAVPPVAVPPVAVPPVAAPPALPPGPVPGGGAPAPKPQATRVAPTISKGSSGENVRTLQYLLREHGLDVEVDGDFGPETEQRVKAFQELRGTSGDTPGVVAATWGTLFVTVQRGSEGDAVRAVQSQLVSQGADVDVDGDFGPQTEQAVRTFQLEIGLDDVDGIVGPQTWAALLAAD